MSAPQTSFVDVELLTHDYLVSKAGTARVCTELPAQLPAQVVRVERIGGGDLAQSLDGARLDVDCFAPTRVEANQFASQVHTWLKQMVGHSVPGATVSEVTVDTFGWRPYTNVNVRSVGMTVQVVLHNNT